MNSNQVPSNDDDKLVKAMAYPFQPGPAGFPASVSADNYVYHRICSLLDTGVGERVMNYDMGVNLNTYVFSNMTAIQKAMLGSAVASSIQRYIPGVVVNSVIASERDASDGFGRTVVFDLVYTVGGQVREQQVVYDPVATGE